jgi:general secretion pathway protein D
MMVATVGRMLAAAAGLAVAVLLAGCAAQQLHREGLDLVAEGRYEEGLDKLADASRAAPGDLGYRADLLRHRERAVNALLARGDSERAAGRADAALAMYRRVLVLEPENRRAKLGVELLQMDQRHAAIVARAEELLKQRHTEAARSMLLPVLQENPKNRQAQALQRRIAEQIAKEAVSEPSLKARFSKPVTLQFRDANLKMVFEALSRTSGINVLMDRDVKPDLKTSIFVKDVSVEDSINLILMQNQLEKKVISDNTVFIYPATPAKLKEYQDLKIRSFHLANADPKQILTMIKTLLKTKDIFVHEKTNSIVMRDTPDAIRLAEKMIADQDIDQAEVMLEVEVLEVSTTRLSELGIKWPSTLSVITPESAATIGELRRVRGNDLLVSPLAATLDLRLEDGDTNVLASPRIRVRNREKAKIMIGSRVPVITNAVTPVSSGTPVVTGSVQYLDVGLKLDVEPDIHLDDEVVIKVALDVSSIVKEVPNVQSGTLAYEIGTRNATTVLRLRDGETQILAGLISDEDRRSAAKVPGLGELPVIGRLFSSHRDNGAKSEIVLSITPRIVHSARIADGNEIEYWAGTESTLRNGTLNVGPAGKISLSSGAPPAGAAVAANTAPPGRGATSPSAQKAAPAAPLVLSWEGPDKVLPGGRVGVVLNVNSPQPVNRLDLNIAFDPDVLKPVEVMDGSFLQQPGSPLVLVRNIDEAAGQIQLQVSSRGSDGVKGSGSLATLTFEAVGPSAGSPVAVERVAPSGPGGEALVAAPPPPHVIKVAP